MRQGFGPDHTPPCQCRTNVWPTPIALTTAPAPLPRTLSPSSSYILQRPFSRTVPPHPPRAFKTTCLGESRPSTTHACPDHRQTFALENGRPNPPAPNPHPCSPSRRARDAAREKGSKPPPCLQHPSHPLNHPWVPRAQRNTSQGPLRGVQAPLQSTVQTNPRPNGILTPRNVRLTGEKNRVPLRPSKGAGVVKLVDTPDLDLVLRRGGSSPSTRTSSRNPTGKQKPAHERPRLPRRPPH